MAAVKVCVVALAVITAASCVAFLAGRRPESPANDVYRIAVGEPSPQLIVPFREGDRWGYRSAVNDAVLIPPRFLAAHSFSEGLAAVRLESTKFAFVNPQGEIEIGPLPFIAVEEFSEGLAAVAVASGHTGYIDRSGNLVIPAIFEGAGPFRGGVAVVGVEGGVAEIGRMLDLGTPGRRVVINYLGEAVGDLR